MAPVESDLRLAADIIAGADALVIAAGAGMGVDSGLPDFRGNDGFWIAYPALAKSQLEFTEVASPRTFERDPALAWGFYGHRLNLYRNVQPHEGFAILKAWTEAKPLPGWVFTSNVDGQFQKAGFDAEAIHECHGSLHHLQCSQNCCPDIWSAKDFHPQVDADPCQLLGDPPVCPNCGQLARPNVLMFGDWGWIEKRSEEQRNRETAWLAEMVQHRARIAVIELGAGTAIPSVRHFSQRLIRDLDARLVRINVRECEVPSGRDVGLGMGTLEALRAIKGYLQPKENETELRH